MNEHDLDSYLRQADPVNQELLEGWEQSDQALGIFERVVDAGLASMTTHQTSPRRPRRRFVGVALGAALLAASTAAAFALISRPTSDPFSVGCYERPDQGANTAVFAIDNIGESLGPAGICATQWQDAFGVPPPANLVTCIVDGGGTGVFPNPSGLYAEEACGAIQASMPAVGTPYGGLSATQVRTLARDLETRYATLATIPGCAGLEGLRAAAAASVDYFGTTAWSVQDLTSATQDWTFPDGRTQTVRVPETASGQRCADYTIDAIGANIVLVNAWPQLPNESS